MFASLKIGKLLESYKSSFWKFLGLYFVTLTVAFHDFIAVLGFFLFIIIANQILSGVMLALSYDAETMLIACVREEEDAEDLYIDDFFWLHERGVDCLFIFLFLHLVRKLYVGVYNYEQEAAWKSGVIQFLVIQVVVFLGLTLCCTHLSDITLIIAANALHTFFFFIGKPYYWIFTDKSLNTDTIIRITYLHYISPFILVLFGLDHGVDMHYDWKANHTYDGINTELAWFDEALFSELGSFIDCLLLVIIFCFFIYANPEALSYEIFMWGDVGIINDIRFYGVAPHWYFRPYMGWLLVCPFHKIGIFGLVYFFLIIYFQVYIVGQDYLFYYKSHKNFFFYMYYKQILNPYVFTVEKIDIDTSVWPIFYFGLFILAILYTLSFLPYGRFYNRLGGNNFMLFSYLYIFTFLGTGFLRNSNWQQLNRLDKINLSV